MQVLAVMKTEMGSLTLEKEEKLRKNIKGNKIPFLIVYPLPADGAQKEEKVEGLQYNLPHGSGDLAVRNKSTGVQRKGQSQRT